MAVITFLAALVLAACALIWAVPSWRGGGAPEQAEEAPLPIPPVPPRIAEGDQYEHCLSMLNTDPAGANGFAETLEAAGGGDGALHCHGLAQVALGNAETGATMMEALARASRAPAIARASLFDQAGQAWMIAGAADRAYVAATLALALSPDDPDLLIDRAMAGATLGRFAEAAADLDRALAIDPRRRDALVFRASALRQLNRLDQAEADIDHALALDEDDPEALLERGILRQRRGDRQGAQADWEHAIALDPDSTTADLAQQNLALLEAGPARR